LMLVTRCTRADRSFSFVLIVAIAVEQSISTIMGSVDQLKASFRPSSQAYSSASREDAQTFSDLHAENMVSPTWFHMITLPLQSLGPSFHPHWDSLSQALAVSVIWSKLPFFSRFCIFPEMPITCFPLTTSAW
jgi:hypothetical protein